MTLAGGEDVGGLLRGQRSTRLPTRIFIGREAATEFVRKEGSKYFFRVVERIQFVARDPRAFVLLNFKFD